MGNCFHDSFKYQDWWSRAWKSKYYFKSAFKKIKASKGLCLLDSTHIDSQKPRSTSCYKQGESSLFGGGKTGFHIVWKEKLSLFVNYCGPLLIECTEFGPSCFLKECCSARTMHLRILPTLPKECWSPWSGMHLLSFHIIQIEYFWIFEFLTYWKLQFQAWHLN